MFSPYESLSLNVLYLLFYQSNLNCSVIQFESIQEKRGCRNMQTNIQWTCHSSQHSPNLFFVFLLDGPQSDLFLVTFSLTQLDIINYNNQPEISEVTPQVLDSFFTVWFFFLECSLLLRWGRESEEQTTGIYCFLFHTYDSFSSSNFSKKHSLTQVYLLDVKVFFSTYTSTPERHKQTLMRMKWSSPLKVTATIMYMNPLKRSVQPNWETLNRMRF